MLGHFSVNSLSLFISSVTFFVYSFLVFLFFINYFILDWSLCNGCICCYFLLCYFWSLIFLRWIICYIISCRVQYCCSSDILVSFYHPLYANSPFLCAHISRMSFRCPCIKILRKGLFVFYWILCFWSYIRFIVFSYRLSRILSIFIGYFCHIIILVDFILDLFQPKMSCSLSFSGM